MGDSNLKNIWQEDNDYGKLETLTDEAVKKAEEKLGVKLSDSYINLLKQQNGGYLNYNAHPAEGATTWADGYAGVDHILGIGLGEERGILDSEYLIQEWDLPKNIVLISGDGHTWIALDYRSNEAEPAIIYIDTEQQQEIMLAKNFEGFINGLIEYSEEEMDTPDSEVSEQETKEYYSKIDNLMETGTPKEINNLFAKILSTNNELIRYMVERMRRHKKPKVHFKLLLFLSCCAEGDNKGILEDDYLLDVLQELSLSQNKDVKEFALYSLKQLQNRLGI